MAEKNKSAGDAKSKKADDKKKNDKKKEDKKPELPPLESAISLVRLAAAEHEPRYVVRALRKLTSIRSTVGASALRAAALRELGPHDDKSFVSALPEDDGSAQPMEVDESPSASAAAPIRSGRAASVVARGGDVACPELETFFHLFVVIRLLDDGRRAEAATAAQALVDKVKSFTRPTLTPIAAKAFFYLSRACELLGGDRYAAVRSSLLSAHITASLQHANEAQLTILNLLLRNYLHHALFDQADKLSSKSSRVTSMLTDGTVSNNQIARYLHYQGRIKAVQLAYGSAFEYLEESLRKAPRETAVGFRLASYKFLIIVQLLLGEIPERSVFTQAGLQAELHRYFLLARAVRLGDLEAYNKAVSANSAAFARDETLALVTRLRHNVIKTGLRKINIAYSRIGFAEIAEKLRLDSAKDAEYICAKAIRDGVLEASIDHAGKFMQSNAAVNVYSTGEPYEQLYKRIEFCVSIRNDAVRAMRFFEQDEATDVLKKEGDDKSKAAEATAEVDESAALDELDEED